MSSWRVNWRVPEVEHLNGKAIYSLLSFDKATFFKHASE